MHSLMQKDKRLVWSTNCETSGSRSFTKAERRYRVTRKELKRLYILSRRTDPIFMADVLFCALIIVPQKQEGQLAKWMDTLSEYDFKIRNRAGRIHGNADVLFEN